MHVLMTTDAVGGVWNYVVDLVRGLCVREGVHVTLACMGPPPKDHQRAGLVAGLVAGLGCPRDRVELVELDTKLEWMDGCEQDLAHAGEWLLELERARQPDVIHLNGYAHAALAWRAPTLLVAHSCVPSWWRAVHRAPAPAGWDPYRRRVQAGLHRAHAVVAPTAWMLAQLTEHYAVPFAGRVIPNGRAATPFVPSPKSATILAAGRLWDPAKNLGALDAIAEQLAWPIRVAGEPRDPDGRDASPQHMEWLGFLAAHELAWWMSHASIFAHPALYEPFGLAPLEAALSGCALVLGDIPSLRELWADAAVFVSPRDRSALAAALRELIDDPVRRNTLAAAAQTRAKRYTAERMVEAYVATYLELNPELNPELGLELSPATRDDRTTLCAS